MTATNAQARTGDELHTPYFKNEWLIYTPISSIPSHQQLSVMARHLLSLKTVIPQLGEKRMVASKGKDWRELCAEVAEEPDSEKVVSLVHQILQAFDEYDQKIIAPVRQTSERY